MTHTSTSINAAIFDSLKRSSKLFGSKLPADMSEYIELLNAGIADFKQQRTEYHSLAHRCDLVRLGRSLPPVTQSFERQETYVEELVGSLRGQCLNKATTVANWKTYQGPRASKVLKETAATVETIFRANTEDRRFGKMEVYGNGVVSFHYYDFSHLACTNLNDYVTDVIDENDSSSDRDEGEDAEPSLVTETLINICKDSVPPEVFAFRQTLPALLRDFAEFTTGFLSNKPDELVTFVSCFGSVIYRWPILPDSGSLLSFGSTDPTPSPKGTGVFKSLLTSKVSPRGDRVSAILKAKARRFGKS